jgi:hypothetical protein
MAMSGADLAGFEPGYGLTGTFFQDLYGHLVVASQENPALY